MPAAGVTEIVGVGAGWKTLGDRFPPAGEVNTFRSGPSALSQLTRRVDRETVSATKSRNGPAGASHFWCRTPFPDARGTHSFRVDKALGRLVTAGNSGPPQRAAKQGERGE